MYIANAVDCFIDRQQLQLPFRSHPSPSDKAAGNQQGTCTSIIS